MHNLKTNFDKIFPIVKSALKDLLLPCGNLYHYRNKPKMTDSEVITLSLLAESLGIDSENLLFIKLKTEYSSHFTNLVDRSNFNRRRRRLMPYYPMVSEYVFNQIDDGSKTVIIDSIPIPICQKPRVFRSKICKDDPLVQPAPAYHASHKLHYYGFKMQLLISRQGVPLSVGLTAGNVHDVNYLSLLDNKDKLAGYELLADKGYISIQHQTSLFEQDRIRLITPLRSNMTTRTNLWNGTRRYFRKRVETLFSQLCDQMMLKRNYAKTLDGLFSRIITKLSAIACLQFINVISGKPINRLKHALAI